MNAIDRRGAQAEEELWSQLRALGDAPRRGEGGEGDELDDEALLAKVLSQVGVQPGVEISGMRASLERRAPEPVIAPVPSSRRRAYLRRGVAGTFAGVALAATLLVAFAAELGGRPFRAPASASVPEPPPEEKAMLAAAKSFGRAHPARVAIESTQVTDSPSAVVPVDAAPAEPAKAPTASPIAAPAPSGGSADELLQRAQAHLGAGRTADALAAYRLLVARHPSSPEARAALISLGRMTLSGSPGEAIGYFDRYLGGGGPLAEEARLGRVESLRRLGRGGEEAAAIADFLARYPGSVHAERLRARAENLNGN